MRYVIIVLVPHKQGRLNMADEDICVKNPLFCSHFRESVIN